ncbi:MAG: carbohydrate-binding domain-containing protein [Candidatus Saccharimonadales bacterium]
MNPPNQLRARRILAIIALIVILLSAGKGITHIVSKQASNKSKFSVSPDSNAFVVSDIYASGGNALELYSNARATKYTETPNVADIVVTAKGDQCNGAPAMDVAIDDNIVLSINVSSTSYSTYTAEVKGIKAGNHKVEVRYNNDLNVPGDCDRNLVIDKIEFTPAG